MVFTTPGSLTGGDATPAILKASDRGSGLESSTITGFSSSSGADGNEVQPVMSSDNTRAERDRRDTCRANGFDDIINSDNSWAHYNESLTIVSFVLIMFMYPLLETVFG